MLDTSAGPALGPEGFWPKGKGVQPCLLGLVPEPCQPRNRGGTLYLTPSTLRSFPQCSPSSLGWGQQVLPHSGLQSPSSPSRDLPSNTSMAQRKGGLSGFWLGQGGVQPRLLPRHLKTLSLWRHSCRSRHTWPGTAPGFSVLRRDKDKVVTGPGLPPASIRLGR